jgi:glycosyltransferase involved in cell wall biosynthesis
MPKVSVIIPTYNRARLLSEAVASVLAQSFQDLEIIIVDDASNDATQEAIAKFCDVRIRYFRHAQNRGEAACRNAGVAHAAGDYIAFLDDDDTWLPQKLALQVALLDRSPARVGGVYTGYYRVDIATGATVATVPAERRGAIYADLREQNWVGSPSGVVLRRQCFDRVGRFDEDIKFGVDYDMWIRISRCYDFETVNEPLVRYAVHPDRLSANSGAILYGKERQLAKYADYFAGDRRSYGRYFLSLGVLYCYNRRLAEGRAALCRSIRIYPFEMRPYINLFFSLWGSENFIRMKSLKDRVQRSFTSAARH